MAIAVRDATSSCATVEEEFDSDTEMTVAERVVQSDDSLMETHADPATTNALV
jgi:hypothetical protein